MHLSSLRSQLKDNGNMFFIVRNKVGNNGDVVCDFFDLIDAAIKSGLFYVNTIVVPTETKVPSELPDNVLYVVWMAANKTHFFNKDAIRESHIWKNVEWGKRAKNYHPKGKDPGNVWIPTKDDGKANITEHILLHISTIINRLHSCTKQDGSETVLVTSHDTDTINIHPDIKVIYNTTAYTHSVDVKQSFVQAGKHESGKQQYGKIVWGTSEVMDDIDNGTIQVVVTSPPYWDLKDYFKPGQIGQESYDLYLVRLARVWKGCYDKLTPDGSMWVNINIRTKNGKAVLLPHDIIAQCKKTGFHYKGLLIWHKSSGIPTHDRNVVDRHEYILIFSKGKRLRINDTITKVADYKNTNINGGLFWNINRKAGSVGKHFIHPAIYPTELVARIVRCATDVGDVVLDPFLGSGTTIIAAVNEGRSCIGYEYNEGFQDLILSRISNETNSATYKLINE